jgi:hypothetical protein
MTISKALKKRIETDAQSPAFWYVPKGKSVASDNWPLMANFLRELEKFRKKPWDEAQALFAHALQRKRFIDPYHKDSASSFSAVARMQLPVWRLLGLAWINCDNIPEVTEVGRAFIAADQSGRRDLLTTQLHRFQFANPTHAPHFREFKTFPVLALYRLLQNADWHLDWQEFALFGTRIRSFDDADVLADIIEDWRKASSIEQEKLLMLAKTLSASSHTKSEDGTTWRKVSNSLAYLRALLGILPTLLCDNAGICVPKTKQREVRQWVRASQHAEIIDYQSEQDWLAEYGQILPASRGSTPWTNADNARDYYERIGRIDQAASALARADTKLTTQHIEHYRKVQILERVLEDILEHNLDELEPGLRLIGRQYATAVGPIDLLAMDANKVFVIIELKRGRTSDRVVGQVARYLNWATDRLAQGNSRKVRAIVVGRDYDKHFRAAIGEIRRVTPYTFDILARFDRWPVAA